MIGTATLWLAATGQLVLYIHPRYVVFTVVMTLCGMGLALVALARSGDSDEQDEHAAADGGGAGAADLPRSRRPSPVALGAALVVTLVAVALVVLPPAVLSSATASTRGLGAAVTTTGSVRTDGATTKYTVLDWASKLRASTDIGSYENESVDVTGFVSPSPDDPDDTFYVTRFVITCCAVDAQPVGVPVYAPAWKDSLEANQWVRIQGAFATNPSAASSATIALVPRAVSKIDQPHDPYLY